MSVRPKQTQTSNDNVITSAILISYMPVSPRQLVRREALNIRIQPQVRELIDRAARLAGKNRTDFMLDAARRAAEDTLLDRTVLSVTAKEYRQFLARLDSPPQPNKRLLKSLRTPTSWE